TIAVSLHRIILLILASLSLLFNLLLIILILQLQSNNLGRYRFLLITFACCDIIISIFNALTIPTFYQIEYGLVTFTWAGINHPFGFYFNVAFVILFYEPFVLLAFHFVYRYLHLQKTYFINNHWILLVASAICMNASFNCSSYFACAIASYDNNDFFNEIMESEFNINMHSHPRPNIIAVNYIHKSGGINVDCFISVSISISLVMITVGSSLYFAVHIIFCLKTRILSNQTRALQIQLFRALVVQFTVPFMLCLLPLTCMTMLPLTGIRFGEMGTIMGIIIAVFPAADPIMTILCIFAAISVFGLLILFILNRKRKLLGGWLLLSFAIRDIIISLYHAYVLPTFYQFEFGLVLFTCEGLYKPPLIGFICNTLYCILFYEPFVLLTFHFIYRYIILEKPNLISRNPFATVLSVIFANLLFSTIIAYDSYLVDRSSSENFFDDALFEEFGIDMTTDPPPNIVPVNYIFAIPFFICFIPFSAICLLPLTGIRFGETGNIMGIFVSLFPAVDPFMVLFMIASSNYGTNEIVQIPSHSRRRDSYICFNDLWKFFSA
ncbi:hypothetical protein PRIPAC_77122, partial [Pristionchus pacificus]|uniref:G protein-coupled receptor n=1 Tax=Pristionchus pacificus TaxID=54126 RepID=A0A2A6C2U0_PRIPA